MIAQRYPTKERASIEIYGKSGNFIANLKDISQTGACLEWTQQDVALQKGDLVRLTVLLKALNRRHNVSAEVMWVNGNRTGVAFIGQDEILDKMLDR